MIDWERVNAAYDEFTAMTPEERSAYYEGFFDDWELTVDEESEFWEMYREDN